MIKFSIAIPAYKGQYLSEAISSVLSQTYPNFELIIVDDCSPEDLKSIVQRFTDRRIKYYRNDANYGPINVVDNWNKCLEYSSGDYIVCMGDDDRLLPCCLEEYVRLIEIYPSLNVYHAWTQIIDENSQITRLLEPRPEFEGFYEYLYYLWMGRLQYIGDFCYRLSHLRECGGYYKLPLAWGTDDITAARAVFSKGVANTQKVSFEYRISSITISSSSNRTAVKLNATLDEMEWYSVLLGRINTDKLTDVDRWYYNSLLSIKEKNRRSRMLSEMILSIKSDWLSFFHWFIKCSSLGIRRRDFLLSCIKRLLLHI